MQRAFKSSPQIARRSRELFRTLLNADRFFVIAGLNVIESEEQTVQVARTLRDICDDLALPLVFKASFDKANRSSVVSYRGVGLDAGLKILEKVKDQTLLPVLTDVHCLATLGAAASVVDVVQIPAFLCRQTDLLLAAGQSGRIVHIKKGQFASPRVAVQAAHKVLSTGNSNVILCERGFAFGYDDLVFDPTSIPEMRRMVPEVPLVVDVSHSLQKPGGKVRDDGTVESSGRRFLIPTMARCAVAIGCNGLFLEVHPCPDEAPVDSQVQWPLGKVHTLLSELLDIAGATRARETSCV
ncbi:2-dehydro-3-deoxyphosphooctonate aldolase 2 [Porphyridium purpureum]|uniref:3-deoxy-8-phosphooctulonate synthase n=1 Tax=Porphyridium purpureum TaxID=35688 RepID=A0A5J4YUP5_PORPP|nr:2-dehydro-3-deoxyphosphooctonate aldolase 2 [Porphyridium purpureum]|eukprot:POR1581..scf227_4